MSDRKKVSDAKILEAFQTYGGIRETARNLPITYFALYERLKKLGAIRNSFVDTTKAPSARTLPEGDVLLIPDTQAPGHHPDAIPFLLKIRDTYKPKHVVSIGDEIDASWLSDFAKQVEQDQPLAEIEAARNFMRELSTEFDAISCVSNHVQGRFERARLRARIPEFMLKDLGDILDVPERWSWHSEIKVGDVIIRHGHKDVQNLKRVIVEELPALYGRHYSILIGHYHSKMGQATPDIMVGGKFFWGGFTGCLVNPRHPFFNYSRGYERLGTVMIRDGRLRPFAMPLDALGRWTGELI